MNRLRKILLAAASMLPAMAYAQQIPLLPQAATPLSGKEIAVIVQGGITKQVGIASISGTATLPTIAANTLLGNSTSAPAPTFALALPNCGGGLQALTYTAGNGFGCNTISTTATAGGQNGQFQINNNGALAGTPSLTISGTTITGPDGTTWAPSGLANSANFTTAGTSLLSLTPNVSYSGAGNFAVNTVSPIVTPTNVAFNGYTNGLSIGNTLGSGTAINVLTMRAMSTGLVIQAGYTGTVAAGIDFLANTPTLNGANAYTNFVEFLGAGISNGSGLVTGAVANFGLQIQAPTAVAGIGGTITNTSASISLASGVNAGTAINTGISISGNGQTGGTVTNWAINSTSTAPSQFAGPMAFTAITFSSSASGNNASEFLNRYAADSFGQSLTFQKSRNATIGGNTIVQAGDTLGLVSFGGADGTTFRTAASIYATVDGTPSAGIVPGRLHFQTTNASGTLQEDAFFNVSGVFNVSSGLANSVTLAGSATNPLLGSSNGTVGVTGALLVGPGAGTASAGSGSNGPFSILGTASARQEFYFSSGAADQKTWDFGGNNSFCLRALNDAYSVATNAYCITEGTTFNIAKHDWSTSATAGTAVQGMELTSSAFTVGDGTHTSFVANSPGASAWVNAIQVSGNVTGFGPALKAAGSDTNVNLLLGSQGAGQISFLTGALSRQQFAVLDNASGADYLTVQSSSGSGILGSNAGAIVLQPANAVTLLVGGLGVGASGGASVNTAHEEFHGAAPAVVAGTSATIVGNDSAGRVTVGSTPSTTVALTFVSAWNNAPICFAQDETTSVTMRVSAVSTTTVTFTASTALVASNAVSYRCQAYN